MGTYNYMDYYNSPEDFIRAHTTTRSKYSVISRDGLIDIAKSNGISVERRMSKSKIFDLILENMSLETFADMLNCGVSSGSFQEKFGITHQEVKHMARLGFIKITGKKLIRIYGKYCYEDLYSVFDYFRLTNKEIQKFLEENPKGIRKNT